ncbi:uncharacterized protein LOC119172873 [Rhipicephalus microplus]|uniref:uncharacterized protein LOC119172873 n=1 Tax=Rhipicephalus microplus TaxID=6941 RepID=UPI003F6CC5EC
MRCRVWSELLVLLFLLRGFCCAVTIRRLIVPRWVRNGTETPAVLDCEYVYNENDLKLVVKWFFNDGPEPVYQWIPEMRLREAFGVLQGRLDDTFSVNSRDVYSQYRAIRILRPTWELSGKYTCMVTSLAGQDVRHQDMTIFVPAKSFSFNYSSPTPGSPYQSRSQTAENALRLLCVARGTYPRPELNLYLIKGAKRRSADEAGFRTFTTTTVEEGLFDVVLHADMPDSQLSSIADLFECVLEIPHSNYAMTRSMSIAHELTWGAYGSSGASCMPVLSLYCVALTISIYMVSPLHRGGDSGGKRYINKDIPKRKEDT